MDVLCVENFNMTAPNGNEGGKTKALFKFAFLPVFAEVLGAYCFEIADGLTGHLYLLLFVHWVSLYCIVAGLFVVWHKMVEGKDVSHKRKRVWAWYFGSCIVNFLVVLAVWWPHEPLAEKIVATNKGWQPPELPPDCTNITVDFGTLKFDEPRWMAEIEHDESSAKFNGTNYFTEAVKPNLMVTIYDTPNDTNDTGTTFRMKDLPYSIEQDEKKMPDYSPRRRRITMTSQAMKIFGGGFQTSDRLRQLDTLKPIKFNVSRSTLRPLMVSFRP
jgi:hypothetical protein